MIEHKLYGMLTCAVAFVETLRRLGRVQRPAWVAPLVLLVLAGGLSLFVHSHGNHPEAAKIQFQHSLLGIVDVGAAFAKGVASWLPGASSQMRNGGTWPGRDRSSSLVCSSLAIPNRIDVEPGWNTPPVWEAAFRVTSF